MRHFVKACLAGVLLGGIVHILIILLIPHEASKDAWSEINRLGAQDVFHLLPLSQTGANGLSEQDPFMLQAVCRFSTTDAAREIKASIQAPFWSIGLFNPLGISLFSANDSASDERNLRLLVITPLQLAGLEDNQDVDFSDALLVETSEPELFVILRAFADNEQERELIRAELNTATCLPYQPELIDDGRIR